MQLYCRLKQGLEGTEKVTVFTSCQKNPKTLVFSSRALKLEITKNLQNDRELKEAVGLMNSCVLYNFDRVCS
jgi:hypothetical protein